MTTNESSTIRRPMTPSGTSACARVLATACLAAILAVSSPHREAIAAPESTAHASGRDAAVADADELAAEERRLRLFAVALGDLARGMLVWIGEHSDYEVDRLLGDPPTIVFTTSGDTLDLGYGLIHLEPHVRGIYQPDSDVVVLTLPWSFTDPVDRSILLHELVHAVQLSSREWHCLVETEWEAHQLQRRWLAEQDVDMVVDWLFIGMLSRCPEGPDERDAAWSLGRRSFAGAPAGG